MFPPGKQLRLLHRRSAGQVAEHSTRYALPSQCLLRRLGAHFSNRLTEGLGYLQVKDPSRYNNLPYPLEGYNGTVFTTSLTHQLQCLYNIVEVHSSLQSGKYIAPQIHGHLPHCFEYLRQSIMCCGDTALEGQQTTFGDNITGSDGWDAKHVCKYYGQLVNFLKDQRADDEIWI